MTVINPNSISGITSITLPSGGDNVLTIHTNDGIERFRIDSSGNVKVGSAATISPDGDVFFTGVCTATTLSGAASGLTGALPAISAANLTNVPAANVVGVHTSLTVTNATTTGTAVVGGGVTISESGIEASGIGITVANINGGAIGGRRNKITNGAMQVSQRGTSESSVTSSGFKQAPDRWRINLSGPTVTVSQSTDSPDGFSNSYKIDITTADTSISGSDRLILQTRLEGQDLQDFAKGTSSAKDFMVSFYCKSTKTGTFTVELEDNDNTGDGGARSVSRHFTISNTNWNRYVINFGADTTGAFDNDNGKSLTMFFWLMAGGTYAGGASLKDQWGAHIDNRRAYGTTNGADSTDNDFYFTGVQLEVGSQATPFEHRSFGDELALCQRYFEIAEGEWYGPVYGTDSDMRLSVPFKVTKRANPTLVSISTDENCCTSVSVVGANYDSTLGARVQGNNVFNDGANRHFSAKFSADSEF